MKSTRTKLICVNDIERHDLSFLEKDSHICGIMALNEFQEPLAGFLTDAKFTLEDYPDVGSPERTLENCEKCQMCGTSCPTHAIDDGRFLLRVDRCHAYGSFEDTIPAGQYGAGEVIIWDQGEYESLADMTVGLEAGSINFRLHGRNPQTGKAIKIAARTNGKFTPGKALKDLNPKPVKAAAKAPAKKK
jgi:hypothetical protein